MVLLLWFSAPVTFECGVEFPLFGQQNAHDFSHRTVSARQLRPPERRLVEFGNAVRDHHPDSGAPHRREIDHIVPHVQTLLRGEPLLPQHAFKRLEFVFAVFVDESEPELRGTHPVRFRCAPGEQPDFDPRNYGYSKLSKLIKALGRFDWKTEGTDNSEYFVRDTQRDRE